MIAVEIKKNNHSGLKFSDAISRSSVLKSQVKKNGTINLNFELQVLPKLKKKSHHI